MAWQLLIAVVLYVVGELIRKPKFPEDAEAVAFEDAGLPRIDPKAPKAVVWGKETLRDPHIMDAVEYFTTPITQTVKATLFKKKDVIIGFNYFMGMQLGLGEGPLVLTRIYYDERILFEGTAGSDDNGVAIVIDEPDFLGGPQEGGGLVGTIRFFAGTPTQNISTYLDGFHPGKTPAYRRVAYVQLEGFGVGESPSIDGFAFEVSRYPNPLGLTGADLQIDGEVFNEDTNVYDVDANSELNPAALLYELWTNTRWGMKRPLVQMDTAQWVAQGVTLAAENHGISLKWVRKQSNKKLAETVTRQIQGLVVFNHDTGLWELRLAREPTSGELAAAPTFAVGSSMVKLRNFSRITQSELTTQTLLNWTDRTLPTRPPAEVAANMALFFALSSQHQTQELTFPGVHGPTLARNLASRENKQASFPISTLQIEVDRTAWDLLPNDIFFWAFDPLGIIQIVYRIVDISPGKARLGQFNITAVQDRFSIAETIFDNQPPLATPIATPPVQVPDLVLSEMPWYLVLQDETANVDETGVDAANTIRPYFVAQRPSTGTPREVLAYFERNDNDELPTVMLPDLLADYNAKGALAATLTQGAGLGGTSGVTFTVTGLSSRDAAMIEAKFLAAADAQTNEIVIRNKVEYNNILLLIDPTDTTYDGATTVDFPRQEQLAVTDLSRTGNDIVVTCRRAMGDTPPQFWPAGSTEVWFLTGAVGRFSANAELAPFDDFVAAELFTMAVQNIAGNGSATLSGAPVRGNGGGMLDRANLPLPAGDMEVNGEPIPVTIVSIGGDIDITWNHRNRLSVGTGILVGRLEQQYWEDANANDLTDIWTGTPTHEYRLEIYDDTLDNLERTETQSTTGFNYTNGLQITDGGPFAKVRLELRARIISGGTPFNLVDIIRIVSVKIPLNLLRRGPIFDQINSGLPTVYYPLQEDGGPFVDVRGLGSDMTVVGDVVTRQQGPTGHDFSVFFPAVQNTFITVVDETANDGVTNTFFSLFFRCSRIPSGEIQYIMAKGPTNDVNTSGWAFVIGADGIPKIRSDAAGLTQNGPNNIELDDGRWHHFCVWFTAVSTPGHRLYIDGQIVGTQGGAHDLTEAFPIWIGNANDATADFHEFEVAHVAWWKATDTPGNVGLGTNPFLAVSEIYRIYRHLEIRQTPYLRTMIAHLPVMHHRFDWSRFGSTSSSTSVTTIDTMLHGSRQATTMPNWTDDGVDPSDANMRLRGPFPRQQSHYYDQAGEDQHCQEIADWGLSGSISPARWEAVPLQGTEYTLNIWVNWTTFNAASVIDVLSVTAGVFGSNPTSQQRFVLGADSTGRLEHFATINGTNGATTNACRVHGNVAAELLETGRDYMISFRKTADTILQLFVNGREIPVVETLTGTATSMMWWDDWGTGAGTSRRWVCSNHMFNTDNPGDNFRSLDGRISHGSCWPDEHKPVDTFKSLYIAGYSGELTMTEWLARDNPRHILPVRTSVDAADLLDNAADGQPTATGTFATADTLLALDNDPGIDSRANRVTPTGFRGGERLAYASALLEAKSTTDLDDVTFVVCFRSFHDGDEGAILYNNDSGGAEATVDSNLIIEARTDDTADNEDKVRWDVSPPSGEFISTPDNSLDPGRAMCLVLIEEGSGAGKTREIWQDGLLVSNDSGDLDEYTGAAVDRLLLGNRNTGSNLFFDGNIAHIAAFDRVVDKRIASRIGFRFLAYTRDEIAVLQYADDVSHFFRCEQPLPDGPVINNLINDVGSADLSPQGGTLPDNEPPGGALPVGWKYPLVFVADTAQAASGAFEGLASYPLSIGGWFRVSTASADAFFSIYDPVVSSDFIAVGLINDAAGYNLDTTENTSGSVTNGDWAHVVVVLVSDVVKRIYLNGELQTTITTSTSVPGGDQIALNQYITSGGTTFADGQYTGQFIMNYELLAADVMEIYSDSLWDPAQAGSRAYGAHAIYPLDEFIDNQLVFLDAEDPAEQGTGTGLTQGVTGIIAARKGFCVQADGTNDIDLVRTDYPAVATERAFEFYIEGGFTGTLVSMGADADAQALVISVDGSGDVLIHIRGTGNERTWTTDLDTGTTRHVVVMLPATGDSLFDFEVFVDGVEVSGTGGTDTTLNTTATLALTLLSDVTDIGKAQGNGKLQNFAFYTDVALLEGNVNVTDEHIEALFNLTQ